MATLIYVTKACFKCGDLSLFKYCAESNIRARASLLDSCNPFRPPHEHITEASKQTNKQTNFFFSLHSVRQRSFGRLGRSALGSARHWAACDRHELLPHLLGMKPLSDWERLLGEIVLEARARTRTHAHARTQTPTHAHAHARARTPKQQARARALTGINARARRFRCACAPSPFASSSLS